MENNKRKNKKHDLLKIGDRLGKLEIIGIENVTDRDYLKSYDRALVKCDCGVEKTISRISLYVSRSCGCLTRENIIKATTIHSFASRADPYKRAWYDKWKEMRRRCYNPKCKRYKDYGGRGIIMCDRWLEPNGQGAINYYNDIHDCLGPKPGPGYSLDRIDNDGIYIITNMRWATISEQNKNQRRRRRKSD